MEHVRALSLWYMWNDIIQLPRPFWPLSLAKNIDYVTYCRCTRKHQFLNDIIEPLFAQVKWSMDKYACNFDTMVEYLSPTNELATEHNIL